MSVVYCAVSDVERVLGLSADYFTTATVPTASQVEAHIITAQDLIDNRTNHAWRTASVSNEFYDLPSWNDRRFRDGLKVFLNHRKIRPIISETDKIELFLGNAYTDIAATGTEGRANDFWLDYNQGVLYLKTGHYSARERGLRMTYRYGETSVPADVRDAAAMLAAMELVTSDDHTMVLPETGDPTRMTHDLRVSRWRSRVDKILRNRTEIRVF